jgi:hypothetical protein
MKTSRLMERKGNTSDPEALAHWTCRLGERGFVQRGDAWVDTAVQQMPNAKRIRIRFDSREFFEIVAKYPKALPLALTAKNVQFAMGDTVYEIHE